MKQDKIELINEIKIMTRKMLIPVFFSYFGKTMKNNVIFKYADTNKFQQNDIDIPQQHMLFPLRNYFRCFYFNTINGSLFGSLRQSQKKIRS